MAKMCPNGHEVNDNVRFCPTCGAEVSLGGSRFCKKCGNERLGTENFCSKCGTPFVGVSTLSTNDITYNGNETNNSFKMKIILPVVIGVVLLAFIGGGWYYWDYSNKKSAGEKSIVDSRVLVRQESNNSAKEKNTETISNEGSSKLHNYGLNTHHHLVGTFEDASGVYPVELDFTSDRETVTDVVYKNVTYGGKIRMTCSFFDQRRLTVEGKDGRNKFVISLECIDKNGFKGTAKDGAKKLLVVMSANCSHK
jgi:hypothetical protein